MRWRFGNPRLHDLVEVFCRKCGVEIPSRFQVALRVDARPRLGGS